MYGFGRSAIAIPAVVLTVLESDLTESVEVATTNAPTRQHGTSWLDEWQWTVSL